jgi:hypothetical protein
LAGFSAGIRNGRSREWLPGREGRCGHGCSGVRDQARRTGPAPTAAVLTNVHTIRVSGGLGRYMWCRPETRKKPNSGPGLALPWWRRPRPCG